MTSPRYTNNSNYEQLQAIATFLHRNVEATALHDPGGGLLVGPPNRWAQGEGVLGVEVQRPAQPPPPDHYLSSVPALPDRRDVALPPHLLPVGNGDMKVWAARLG